MLPKMQRTMPRKFMNFMSGSQDVTRAMIAQEAELGGRLFGVTPAGQKRQFFCLNSHTWVHHQEWTDANGQPKYLNTLYEVRNDGVFKSHNGQSYQKISSTEAQNLLATVKLYEPYVMQPLYGAAA